MSAALGGLTLRGLTLRGRGVLVVGVVAAAAGLLLGERDLLRAGVFLAALPLAAVIAVARTRFRLSCTRSLRPSRVAAGTVATVVVRVQNVSLLPTGLLLVEDTLPYTFGTAPRLVLDRLAPGAARELSYRLRADVRGRYPVGPLTVRLADPFGLCRLTRVFADRDLLTVTPTTVPLPPLRLGGGASPGGRSTAARPAHGWGDDGAIPREYRHGDDLRRVHWRSTARRGELMVRPEEQPPHGRVGLLLDDRLAAHRGEGVSSSFEAAVGALASIGVHLLRAGYDVDVATSAGPLRAVEGSATRADPSDLLLDALAGVRPRRSRTLTAGLGALGGHGDQLLVGVLGSLDGDDLTGLVRACPAVAPGVAVLLDTASWVGTPPAQRSTGRDPRAVLAAAGWRVLPLASGASLAAVWPHAGGAPLLAGAPTPPTGALR